MGLFNKKKKDSENQNSIASSQNNNLLSPIDFYNQCVEDFHNTALQKELAKNGVIFIPELIPIGERTVLSYLQNDAINADLGQNPAEFYYVMVRLAIQAGLAFGEKWHLDFFALQNGYVDQVINRGAAQTSNHILAWLGLYEDEEQDEFYRLIYERWVELHEPYWQLEDARQHTFKAILAAYQLGISMVLCKYGF